MGFELDLGWEWWDLRWILSRHLVYGMLIVACGLPCCGWVLDGSCGSCIEGVLGSYVLWLRWGHEGYRTVHTLLMCMVFSHGCQLWCLVSDLTVPDRSQPVGVGFSRQQRRVSPLAAPNHSTSANTIPHHHNLGTMNADLLTKSNLHSHDKYSAASKR